MRKPDTMDGSHTPSEWWKHLKYMKRAVHKAERKNWKRCIENDLRVHRPLRNDLPLHVGRV